MMKYPGRLDDLIGYLKNTIPKMSRGSVVSMNEDDWIIRIKRERSRLAHVDDYKLVKAASMRFGFKVTDYKDYQEFIEFKVVREGI